MLKTHWLGLSKAVRMASLKLRKVFIRGGGGGKGGGGGGVGQGKGKGGGGGVGLGKGKGKGVGGIRRGWVGGSIVVDLDGRKE